MELTNTFELGVPVERAWALLTDVERVVPCLPGAQLHEVDGDELRGVFKVRVGPLSAEYHGRARFLERDEAARRVVLAAEGHEARGQGEATATVTADFDDVGGGTQVRLATALEVTGRVARFGRGILADVSTRLLDELVGCLEADLSRREAPSPPPYDQDRDLVPLAAALESARPAASSTAGRRSRRHRPAATAGPVVTVAGGAGEGDDAGEGDGNGSGAGVPAAVAGEASAAVASAAVASAAVASAVRAGGAEVAGTVGGVADAGGQAEAGPRPDAPPAAAAAPRPHAEPAPESAPPVPPEPPVGLAPPPARSLAALAGPVVAALVLLLCLALRRRRRSKG